jgi:transposase
MPDMCVAEKREEGSLDAFWSGLSQAQGGGRPGRGHGVELGTRQVAACGVYVGSHISNWAVRSRLHPMLEKARMLRRRFENIVTYLKHRITNAASEFINSKVQWVKYTARGFRNKANLVAAIYFHRGGPDLAPLTANPECP